MHLVEVEVDLLKKILNGPSDFNMLFLSMTAIVCLV